MGERLMIQRHSIPVDVELPMVSPLEVLFYGTGKKYTDSIDRIGIILKSRLYIQISGDEETAVTLGSRHGKLVVYKVATREMEKDGYVFYKFVDGV